jgi:hypothetical protein
MGDGAKKLEYFRQLVERDDICQVCGEWPCACWWICPDCKKDSAECCCAESEG